MLNYLDHRTLGRRRLHVVALTILFFAQHGLAQEGSEARQILRAGMIGLDTSHVIAFTRVFNDPQAKGELHDIQVVAGYPGGTDFPPSATRVEGFTEQLRGMGIEIVDSIPQLLEKVDVVLLESVDGRPHLEQVLPVLKAGKPVFIDKPVAGSLQDAIAIFEAAKLYEVPVFSSSSIRFHAAPQRIRNGEIGEVLGCDTHGPCSIEPSHPDLFWYGIHGVEGLFTCMGTGCDVVTRVTTDDFDMVVGRWKNGRIGSFRGLRAGKIKSGGIAFGSQAVLSYEHSGGYQPMLVEVAKFFRTGQPPVSAEETIEIMAFMEAADESKRRGGAPVSIDHVMSIARKSTAWKGQWNGGGEHGGELRCLARNISGNDWEATFTGYCDRKFVYEVNMKGKQEGDQVVFRGEADLGDKDGGPYQWTGEIVGQAFVGRYSSESGKKGTFKMERPQ